MGTTPPPLGQRIRSLFGPFEHTVSELYRHVFVNLDDLMDLIHQWAPQPHRILEVGCGEGAMTERLVRAYPSASITAIDITPRLGRLFRGRSDRVEFRQSSVQDIADERSDFDLAILADVLHHVPADQRADLMRAIARALVPGGTFVFKDWARSRSPIHYLCQTIERYITGDIVNYCSLEGLVEISKSVFGQESIVGRNKVSPWENNVVLCIRKEGAQPAR